jgi:phage shock protein C
MTQLPSPSGNKFQLDKGNGKIMGVCSGIANYTGWDANLIRIAFVAAALLGFGSSIILYLLIGLIAN